MRQGKIQRPNLIRHTLGSEFSGYMPEDRYQDVLNIIKFGKYSGSVGIEWFISKYKISPLDIARLSRELQD